MQTDNQNLIDQVEKALKAENNEALRKLIEQVVAGGLTSEEKGGLLLAFTQARLASLTEANAEQALFLNDLIDSMEQVAAVKKQAFTELEHDFVEAKIKRAHETETNE